MGDVCSTCGLPDELCICEDMGKSTGSVTIDTEERSYGKEVTLLSGFDSDVDIDDLSSELKSSLGCGGTIRDKTIELQGNHTDRVESLLEERGFEVVP